jgi:hypothetical protein
MDFDPNDLLSTNVYISKPDLNPNLNSDSNEEFKKYYEKELQKKAESKLISSINKIELNEAEDDTNLLNTNAFESNTNESGGGGQESGRFTRDVNTLISIDSRDRTKTVFPKPNHFKIFLGKTFTNVKSIRMVSLEFPNTDAVINTGNNKIYWRNLEDIELDYTVTTNGVIGYPIYSVDLRTGSYTSATLQEEIQSKMNLVRRRQGATSTPSITPDYHYFVPNLDLDTDVVTLTSLSLQQLPNNPFTTSLSSGVITVFYPEHGFLTNDSIYFVGVKAIAGITATILNTFHRITVIGPNQFTFEVNVKAADTVTGGGNTAKAGLKSPFQLLWGENQSTVAQNIGFVLENSGQLIKTQVQSLENIVQMDITLAYEHNFEFSYTYIGQPVSVGTVFNNLFINYATFIITSITSTISLRVQVANDGIINNLQNNAQANLLKFGNRDPIPVASYIKDPIQSFLITTFTDHNYNLRDINTTVNLYETTDPNVNDDVSYDGPYLVQGVPSSTTIILPGVLGGQNTHSTNVYGTFPRKTPLTTWTVKIDDINNNYINLNGVWYTRIVTNIPHKMMKNDRVTINNVRATPQFKDNYIIHSVLTSDSFLIEVTLSNVDRNNLETAYIGTGLITLSFPSHKFNSVVNIQNGVPFNLADSQNNIVSILPITITTLNSHNLVEGNIVRLSGTSPTYINNVLSTGVEPSMDGGGYIVHSVDSEDSFSIIKVLGTSDSFTPITASSNVTGILGLNNDFYLYDIEDIGGISKTMLNNNVYSVRDIIDENTFTFMAPNVYATSIETGGGSNVYISSLKHGFNAVQTNTKNNILTRSINLQGEDYCFLTCPQLDTMLNTGRVKNIFSRISLDQPPGYMCFKYLSNPKEFSTMPLDKLEELEFSIIYHNGELYDFNDLDFSFTLEITEVVDATNAFNVSSKRGITNSS